jgi:hypothetical protein
MTEHLRRMPPILRDKHHDAPSAFTPEGTVNLTGCGRNDARDKAGTLTAMP